jgi:sodium transport system permease protein
VNAFDRFLRGRIVGAVYRAELTSVLRDRRTVVTSMLVPILLYPIGGLGVAALTSRSYGALEAEASRVCLRGAPEDVAPFAEAFANDKHLRIVPCTSDQPGSAEDATMLAPAGAGAALAAGQGTEVEIRYSSGEYRGPLARDRMMTDLGDQKTRIIAARVAERSLPEKFADPIRAKTTDVAPPQKSQLFQWAPMVIFCLIFFSVLGVFLPSIDLTAGDRERNTLETLLTAPASTPELIAGKFLVVITLGMVTTLLNVASLFGSLKLIVATAGQGDAFPVHLPIAIAVIGASIPSVALAGAVCMALGCLARSFRDAQNYLTPVYLLMIFPAYAGTLPTAHLTKFTAAIPVLNLPLTLKAILDGSVEPQLIVLGALVDIAFATAALLAASRLYGHEGIAFADAEPMDLLRRPQSATLRFTGGEGLSLFAISAALSFYLGLPLTARGGRLGLFLMQSLCIFGPPVGYALWRRLDWRTAFAFRAPGWRPAAAALLAGISAWVPIQLFVRYVQQPVFPVPPEVENALRELVGVGGSWPVMVLLGALTPAIAEEILFRGAVQQSLKPSMGKGAVVLTAALFALMHLDPWRLVPTFLLGLAAGALVWQSGSIWTAILFHFTNNLLAILAATFAKQGPAEEASGPPLWMLVPAALALFAVLRLLRSPRGAPPLAPRSPSNV